MAEITAGTVLGSRFTVVGVLGRGGMATVYLANDQVRGERVALKVLHDHLANTASMRERLRREVLAAGRIRHPNALVAFDLHELEGVLALSLPLHPGRTLQEKIDTDGPLEADALRRLGLQLAGALAEAHRQGVVHRDVTPHNVMIDDAGHAALTDFGLARLEDLRTATATGVVGTAGFAAPEIYQSVRADPRADLYSLGAALYFAATGRPPFEAPNPMGVLKRQLEEDFTPLRQARPDLPADLATTLEAMLRRDPARRPQGARAVLEALESGDATAALEESVAIAAPNGPASRAASDRELEPGRIPAGTWTVIVQARAGDPRIVRRRRSRRLRRRHRAEQRALRRGETTRESLADTLRVVLGEDQDRPEEALAEAVASLAGLPPDALRLPKAMFASRFRLIEGIDGTAAVELAQAAQRLGYRTEVVSQETRAAMHVFTSPGDFFLRLLPIPALLFGILSLGRMVPRLPFLIVFLFPLFFTLFRIIRGLAKSASSSVAHLPLAYTNDLSLHLEEAARAHLAARPPVALPEPVSSPATSERQSGQMGRVEAMAARTDAQLGALEQVLTERAAVLAGGMIRDLRGTLEALRERARALGQEARRIQRELNGVDDLAIATTVSRIEARIQRLETLQQAGQPVRTEELEELRRGLDAHRRTQASIEVLEGWSTLALARLLEIGAAAGQARRDLLRDESPARSAVRLLEQLRQEVDAATGALREVEQAGTRAGGGGPVRAPRPL